MFQKILIVGSGFAGTWAALGAAWALDQADRADGSVEITVISPEPELHIRPRLHESNPEAMRAPLQPLFDAVGVRHIQGRVERIDQAQACLQVRDAQDNRLSVAYDRLVFTAGSQLAQTAIPGLSEHALSIDQLSDACRLDTHLNQLAEQPSTPARNTVVIVGAGFTGIEIACELPQRLRTLLGTDVEINIILLSKGAAPGAELGENLRPVIQQALDELGVTCHLNACASAIEADGVILASGEKIHAHTVIWTGGMRANPLTEQLPGNRDTQGRIAVTRDLRLKDTPHIFAAGDVALARTDDLGNHALMSCQHAVDMGRYAGHNATADLLGLPTLTYQQPFYVTCLDLGPWGAVYTEGWQREVKMQGAEAKALKRKIVSEWIYPPLAQREGALAAGNPLGTVVGD